MTKYIKLSMITAMAVFSIVGCGSSSSSSVETGTGYYVDAAVKGVKYECGTKEGTTGDEGIFTFEKGEGCKFSLAGILLRTTEADDLRDGGYVFENNLTVATLLQSIDADGNLSNGIEITDEVLTALTEALEISQLPEGTLPEGQVLNEVVVAVGGHARTDEEVQKHLAQTQIEITLVGKTVYEYYEDENGNSVIDAITFGEDGTITIDHNGVIETISYRIDGDTIYTTDIDGVEEAHSFKESTDKYIKFDNIEDGDVTTFYFTRADAESASADCSYNLEDLIGKTVYEYYEDENGNSVIDAITFGEDGTITIDHNDVIETISYGIDGNTIYTIEDGVEKAHILRECTDKYIKFDNIEDGDVTTFYFTRADAESASAD